MPRCRPDILFGYRAFGSHRSTPRVPPQHIVHAVFGMQVRYCSAKLLRAFRATIRHGLMSLWRCAPPPPRRRTERTVRRQRLATRQRAAIAPATNSRASGGRTPARSNGHGRQRLYDANRVALPRGTARRACALRGSVTSPAAVVRTSSAVEERMRSVPRGLGEVLTKPASAPPSRAQPAELMTDPLRAPRPRGHARSRMLRAPPPRSGVICRALR